MSSIFGGLGLCRALAPVHGSGWRKANVLLWRPASSTLFLGGGATTVVQLYACMAKLVAPLSG
jgi:hypothetical protein